MVSRPTESGVRIVTDPAHGGRWTSLRASGREWLWGRDEPRRPGVRPGDPFADAGGVEECVPTVRGTPDHGDAWARAWTRDGGTDTVDCPDFRLTRVVTSGDSGEPIGSGAASVTYRLTADPGYRFLWAAHALLDLSTGATIRMAEGARTRLFPEAAGLVAELVGERWPFGAPWIEGPWPTPYGIPLHRTGPDDSTAVGAVVAGGAVCVHDGTGTLRFSLEAEGQPVSVALWRNLGGFPVGGPYRSTGVEPMLGRVFDLADAGPGDAAVVPPSGEVRWRLTVTEHCACARRTEEAPR
ncbi:hypothetical protein ACFVT5_38885 [Streptomyces sp. NPDC058001]|uniref:hypothetical protein n=1 Tax=Streptomyces sp. NPDC058001 TaxID=3346300 RepID=UPI0036E5579F